MICCVQVLQVDVLQTSDGVPVIFHDLSLKRATGVDKNISEVRLLYKSLQYLPHLLVRNICVVNSTVLSSSCKGCFGTISPFALLVRIDGGSSGIATAKPSYYRLRVQSVGGRIA